MNISALLSKTLNFNLGKLNISTSYFQAGGIILLLFLLVLLMAQMRRHFVNWSMKGALFGIFWGFLLALILEGFLIIGGKTAVIEILGWKHAPKPLLTVLDAGRSKLINVLGVSTDIPSTRAEERPTLDDAVSSFQRLSPSDSQKIRTLICAPK